MLYGEDVAMALIAVCPAFRGSLDERGTRCGRVHRAPAR
jgi:hypothetical protein